MRSCILVIILLSGCNSGSQTEHRLYPESQRQYSSGQRQFQAAKSACHAWDDQFIYDRPDIIVTDKNFERLRNERENMKMKLIKKATAPFRT